MVKKTAQHLELLSDCLDWFQTELLRVAAAFLQDILGELRNCDTAEVDSKILADHVFQLVGLVRRQPPGIQE